MASLGSMASRARDSATKSMTLVRTAWAGVRALVERIDPNDDPDAEALTPLPLLVLAASIAFSLWMFLRWRIQPMQDLPHYVGLSAIVSDWGRPGSIYTDLYEPIDPLAANSFLFVIVGYTGRLIGVTHAMRLYLCLYVAGIPLVTAYALRVFGRSVWPAVAAAPLVYYNLSFIAGFANQLFATPFMFACIPLLYRILMKPTRGRITAGAIAYLILFLGHAQLYLWGGFLSIALVVACIGFTLLDRREPLLGRAKHAGLQALVALSTVLPSLVVFGRWFWNTFGGGHDKAVVLNNTGSAKEGFGAYFRTTGELFSQFNDTFHVFQTGDDMKALLAIVIAVSIGVVFARMHRFRRPPVLEVAFALTALSYFFLPDGIKGQEILSQRQPGISLCFLPALLSPVPARISRGARAVVVTTICALTIFLFKSWYSNLALFEREEAVGLTWVMDAMEPRARLHYVKNDPNSKYFNWRPFWHVEKLYMGDKLGQTPDTGAINATSPIRYKPGLEIHRVTDHYNWEGNMEIWRNFEYVLLRKQTGPLNVAKQHGELVRKSGDWQLWRSKEVVPVQPPPPAAPATPPAPAPPPTK